MRPFQFGLGNLKVGSIIRIRPNPMAGILNYEDFEVGAIIGYPRHHTLRLEHRDNLGELHIFYIAREDIYIHQWNSLAPHAVGYLP